MRLSMWILADWLEAYRPNLKIEEGKRTLRNVRLYSEGLQMERSTVYVGNASDFIDGAREQIICANEHDLMLLDAGDINEVLNKILDAFDYYNGWSDHLSEKIRTDYSLGDMLQDSEPILRRMICVADASYYVYAQAGFEKRAGENPDTTSVLNENIMTLDSILAINQDNRIRTYNPQTYILNVTQTGIRCAVRNVFFRGQHRGWLITDKKAGEYTRGEIDVQDELGDLVERWIEYHQSQKELVEKSEVLLQILEGTCERGADGYRRMESMNWRRGDELSVYIIRRIAEGAALDFSLDRKLEQLGAAYTVHFENNLLLVLNSSLTETSTFLPALLQLLEKADCICGKSPAFTDVFDLKSNYELAVVAADYGDDRSIIREIESAALSYYFSLIVRNDKAGVSHPVLQTLHAYDNKHKTQMFITLEVYLRCERNYILTAKTLHLHRNSLIYRIQRIADITGVDLDSSATRLHLIMAYEIERQKTANKVKTGEK